MMKLQYLINKIAGHLDLPMLTVSFEMNERMLEFNPEFKGRVQVDFEIVDVNNLPCHEGYLSSVTGDDPTSISRYQDMIAYFLVKLRENDTAYLDQLREGGVMWKPKINLNTLARSYMANRGHVRNFSGTNTYGKEYMYIVPTKKNVKLVEEGVRKLAKEMEAKFLEAYNNEKLEIKGEFGFSKETTKKFAPMMFQSLFEKGEE